MWTSCVSAAILSKSVIGSELGLPALLLLICQVNLHHICWAKKTAPGIETITVNTVVSTDDAVAGLTLGAGASPKEAS